MPELIKDIFINGEFYTFLFQRIIRPDGDKYFVSVIQPAGDTISFEMTRGAAGEWRIVPPVPDWIMELKETLARMVAQSTD